MAERCIACLPEDHGGIKWPCRNPAVVFTRDVADWQEGYCLEHIVLLPGYRLVRETELDTPTLRQTMAEVASKLRQLEEQRDLYRGDIRWLYREGILDEVQVLAASLEAVLASTERHDA